MEALTEVPRNYARNSNYESAIAFNQRFIPIAESLIKANPNSALRRNFIWSALFYIRGYSTRLGKEEQAFQAGTRMMELTGQWLADNPKSELYSRAHALSLLNHASDLSLLDRDTESLVAIDKAWNQFEANFQNDPAPLVQINNLVHLATLLSIWGRLDQWPIALARGSKLLPRAMELVQLVGNRASDRETLANFFGIMSDAASHMNRSDQAIEFLRLAGGVIQSDSVSPHVRLLRLGSNHAVIGSHQFHLGRVEEAQSTWREALSSYNKAIADADTRLRQTPNNFALHNDSFHAQQSIAQLHDYLNEPQHALAASKLAFERLESWTRLDKSETTASLKRPTLARLILYHKQAGVPPLIQWQGQPVSNEEIETLLPFAYAVKVNRMHIRMQGSPKGLALAQAGIEASRKLLRDRDSSEHRAILAHALATHASCLGFLSITKPSTESPAILLEARKLLEEARQWMLPLPPSPNYVISLQTIDKSLRSLNRKLQAISTTSALQ